jgi:two-component system LytT family response regulator
MRVLVVDDEPLAREKLVGLLAEENDVELVGECRDGMEAITAIGEKNPDVVLLDVQMPELDGFEVIEALDRDNMPVVIFVTAYDQYALKAFEVHAVDYLLKPFDRRRFQEAIQRARGEIQRRETGEINKRLLALIDNLKPEKRFVERLVVKSSGRVFFLKTEEIDWIDSAGNYVRLHVGGESYLLRETMGSLETKLDPQRFLRIHRSTIVNIERIRELQQVFHGDYIMILQNGQRLALSRSYRDKLHELLGRAL